MAASSTLPIPLQLAEVTSGVANLLPLSDAPAQFSELAEKLRLASRSTGDLQVLIRLVNVKLPAILDFSSREQVSELAAAYQTIAEDPETSAGVVNVLSSSAVQLLGQSVGRDLDALTTLFSLCTKLSLRSVTAAEVRRWSSAQVYRQ